MFSYRWMNNRDSATFPPHCLHVYVVLTNRDIQLLVPHGIKAPETLGSGGFGSCAAIIIPVLMLKGLRLYWWMYRWMEHPPLYFVTTYVYSCLSTINYCMCFCKNESIWWIEKNNNNFEAVTFFVLIMIIGHISAWVMDITLQPFLLGAFNLSSE